MKVNTQLHMGQGLIHEPNQAKRQRILGLEKTQIIPQIFMIPRRM
jgi:hypothetical protein